FLSQNAGAIGLVFFFVAFMGIAFWALRPKNKHKIESYKNIPLSENDHV
ncbi:MAG: cbb3-type cytochrome c oxidase subunit 3, partial [Pseudomonadota bacterium]